MKSLISFSIRCFDALLWSVGLSCVVLVLAVGFYVCWTTPFGKPQTRQIVSVTKVEKPKFEEKTVALDKNTIYAGR